MNIAQAPEGVSIVWLTEELDKDTLRLSVEIAVQTRVIGRMSVLSGPKADVEEFLRGEVSLDHLEEIWKMFDVKVCGVKGKGL